jgi:uncharacterized protein (TIGR02246 family)
VRSLHRGRRQPRIGAEQIAWRRVLQRKRTLTRQGWDRCMSDDERAIRELIDTWMAASKAGDTATVLSLMTDDVVFMVPGREPFGKEAFAAAAHDMQGVAIDGRSDIRELKVLGDWAYLRGYLEISVTPPAGNAAQRTGYTLTILHKGTDGRWRLARDANMLTPKT